MNPKLFIFDRDGTLNLRNVEGYVLTFEDLDPAPDLEVLKELSGEKIAVATNQACIGKGLITYSSCLKLTQELMKPFLRRSNFEVFICPHTAQSNCECRKPKPGLLLSAMRYYNTTPKETVFIGDSKVDMDAAHNAEIEFIPVCWNNFCHLKNCCHNLKGALKSILQ